MTMEVRLNNASDVHYLQGGGAVEPGDFLQLFSRPAPPPREWKGERFELIDALGAVTALEHTPYRIWKQADKLGITRYTHTDLDGKRALFEKRGGSWQLSPEPAPASPAPAAQPVAPVTPLEAALTQRYVVGPAQVSMDEPTGQTEYRFRGDPSRVAFTERAFSVSTEVNSPSAVRSMLDLAEARDWQPLRVRGHADFKRMVWLEASIRGLPVSGYEPARSDAEILQREREERLVGPGNAERGANLETPVRGTAPGAKLTTRGANGRHAVLAAIEATLLSRNVPDGLRKAVMEAATHKLAQRFRIALAPGLKVQDQAAPVQRHVVAPTLEVQAVRERAAPVR